MNRLTSFDIEIRVRQFSIYEKKSLPRLFGNFALVDVGECWCATSRYM